METKTCIVSWKKTKNTGNQPHNNADTLICFHFKTKTVSIQKCVLSTVSEIILVHNMPEIRISHDHSLTLGTCMSEETGSNCLLCVWLQEKLWMVLLLLLSLTFSYLLLLTFIFYFLFQVPGLLPKQQMYQDKNHEAGKRGCSSIMLFLLKHCCTFVFLFHHCIFSVLICL